MLQNYLKIALRNLLRNKVYSFINIVGLAIGMAVVLLISLYIQDEYSYDRFNRHANEIFRVTETQKQSDGFHLVAVTPSPLATAMKKDFAEIQQTVRVGQWNGLVQCDGKNLEPERISIVDKDFFDMFDFPLLKGNAKTSFDNPDEVIITEKSAIFLFGKNWFKKNILGKTIVLNSSQKVSLKLVGIMKNIPANSQIQSDVFLPFKFLEKYDEWSGKWNSNSYHTYLKINPKTDILAFEKKIAPFLKKYEANAETTLGLQPLSSIYLRSKFDFQTDWGKRSSIFYVYLFITVGLIILLIAIFNFINLATARATQRVKEVGVRKIVGARRSSLVQQFLIEALLIVLIASFLAIVLADLLLPILNQLSEKTLAIPILQGAFWGITTLFVLVMTLLSGLYPAFILSSFRPVKVLKGYFSISTGKYFRQTLVVGQFALSIVLIVSTFIIYRQLNFMQTKNLGFDKEQLLYVRLKGELKNKAIPFKEEIAKIAGVESVSVTTNNLVNVANSSTLEWQGQQPKDEFPITQMNVDPSFLKTVGAKLIAGRNFSNVVAGDTSDKFGVYLINEKAATRMGWTPEKAIGKKVKFWGFEGNIIGVVKDFHFRSLSVNIDPVILRNRPKEFYFNLLVKTKPHQVSQTIQMLAKNYKKYDAEYPFSYGFVNQDLSQQYNNEKRIGIIVLIFSGLAIIISCMGLFGLVMFTTQLRIKEIGIRKVLGASVTQIVNLLSKDFLKLVILGIVIASPIAYWAMDKWLQDFAYRVDISLWIFALAGIVSIVIALLTVSYQSIKAALANPVKSLRTE
jgi:putative ABC transport system permease protein